MHTNHTALAVSISLITWSVAAAADRVNGDLIHLNNNGAWSWFEDERAILNNGQLLVSSIADSSGIGGAARDGNVDLAVYRIDTGRTTRVTLSDIQADDHNSAALLTRPDGRYLAVYASHGSDSLTRYRISTQPGDATSWLPEQTFDNGVGVTYSNVFYLSAADRTYNFVRTDGYDPNFLVSNDQGSTWSYGGRVLRDPGGLSSGRPYLKYASNGTDRIFFITTEQHPRDYNNGIYAGYMQGGQLYCMDGTLVGPAGDSVATAASARDFTRVLAPNEVIAGATRTHAWTTDLAIDADGRPYAVFTSRVNGSTSDHRFYFGRWDGTQWHVHELAKAGAYLYPAEQDYTGLAALDPDDPNTLYISTRISPIDQSNLTRYEIFRGTTVDGGATWQWSAVTSDSSVDNLRPIMPRSSDGTRALLWMRGTYNTYVDYDMSIVGLVTTGDRAPGTMDVTAATYVDATIGNTARADGGGAWLAPAASGSAGNSTDNLWHQRTGFGNGGSVFTADETGSEDAPLLVTTVTDVPAGQYDVYAFFWSNRNEQWQIEAGLSADAMMLADKQGAQHIILDELTGGTAAQDASGTHRLYRQYLGRTIVGNDGLLRVYINDGTGSVGSRTWYDGIGYAPVPEPAAAGAVVPLGAMMLRRRAPAVAVAGAFGDR